MISKQGIFSISLDFELHWGVFDNVAVIDRVAYFDKTVAVIPKIVNLFNAYEVQATWATVGMLFNENMAAVKANYPKTLPTYKNPKLSAYQFIKTEYESDYERFYTALDTVKLIDKTKGQEVATHTYSHYYTLEEGQTKAAFEADIAMSVLLAQKNNIDLKSIVFPRNQIHPDYLEICRKYGIVNIRTNPTQWFFVVNKKNKLAKKIARTLDCYIPIYNLGVDIDTLNKGDNDIYYHQFSRFLKPISGISILDKLRITRIKSEMTTAAKNGTYYHLWWHPHNFGQHPEKAMEELEKLMKHFDYLKNKYGMVSLNMCNTKTYLQNHGK